MVQITYFCRKPAGSIALCICLMQKGTSPRCIYRLSEWYFTYCAFWGGRASQPNTNEEPLAWPDIQLFFFPLLSWNI